MALSVADISAKPITGTKVYPAGCILTTATHSLMELASSIASPFSISKTVAEIYGVILN